MLGFQNLSKAQVPKTKKITVINTDYSFIGLGGQVRIDTSVTEYDMDGMPKNSNPERIFGPIIYELNTKTIDSSNNRIHKQILFSDSSIQQTYQTNFIDSTVIYSIEKNDTIEKRINYLKRKKLIRTKTWNYKKFSTPYYSDVTTINNNFIFKKTLETITHYKDGLTETKKIKLNRISKTKKTFSFNDHKKEWYLEEKSKFNSKKQLMKSVNQFYHDYHKRYFKSRTKYKYNKFGQVLSEVTFDEYHTIENKKCYYYEYF